VVRVTVNLDVTANSQIRRGDEFVVLVHVFVLLAAQEGALDDATVLHSGLVDRDAVVRQVERDDEAAVHVFRHTRVEARVVAEDLLVIVYRLEEVAFGLLWHQVMNITERVDLVSKTVIWRNLALSGLRGLRHLHTRDLEVAVEGPGVVGLGGGVHTQDLVVAAVGSDALLGENLVAGQVVVADEVEAGLVDHSLGWKSVSLEHHGESVAAIVRVVHLADLNGVVSQEVVDDERQVVVLAEEAKNLAVLVQELLLAGNFATAKSLLHILLHLIVTRSRVGNLGGAELVHGHFLSGGLGLAKILNRKLILSWPNIVFM